MSRKAKRTPIIRKFSLWLHLGIVAVSWHVLSGVAWAAGGPPATKLVNVADTRMMEPGISKWIAEMYNTNLWLYGLTAVVIMALMGLILGLAFDRLMALTGIDLSKLEHHE